MQDTRFWQIVAVVLCLGIFYVGHGLHRSAGEGVPSFVSEARAGGVAVDAVSASGGRQATRIYTTNETGTILYVWDGPSSAGGILPKHVATVGVPKSDWLPETSGANGKK